MNQPQPDYRTFRSRLAAGEQMVGTFVKTPTSHTTEILGLLGFDFVVIDQEHGPVTVHSLDGMLLAARASNIAGIVRVPEATDTAILSALDCGAMGVLVPHVSSRAKAESIAAACRYRGGHRGYSNTTRAGRFGLSTYAGHIAEQDQQVACIAMIEDVEALNEIDEIVRVPGIDAIFIGRGDLTAALNASSPTSAETQAVVTPIMQAARAASMPVIVMSPDRADAERMNALGATAFIIGSDQGFMIDGARLALDKLRPRFG